ncbi:hypothetical protein B6U83_04925, partial [Thermoplasmatales archaeon ex4484_36]
MSPEVRQTATVPPGKPPAQGTPAAPPAAPGARPPAAPPKAPPAAPSAPARRTSDPQLLKEIKAVSATCNALIREVEKAIIGKRNVLEHVILAILADGHILFEDFPGTAKSLMVMTFARALGCKYRRIQFTP